MKVWAVDATDASFSLLIDAQALWSHRVSDIAGVTLDTTSNTMLVLSQVNKRILHVQMDGAYRESPSIRHRTQ